MCYYAKNDILLHIDPIYGAVYDLFYVTPGTIHLHDQTMMKMRSHSLSYGILWSTWETRVAILQVSKIFFRNNQDYVIRKFVLQKMFHHLEIYRHAWQLEWQLFFS